MAGPSKVSPDSDPFSPRRFGFDESFSVSNYFELDWTFGHKGVPEKVTGDGSEAMFCSDNGGGIDPEHPDAHGTNAGLRGRKGDM